MVATNRGSRRAVSAFALALAGAIGFPSSPASAHDEPCGFVDRGSPCESRCAPTPSCGGGYASSSPSWRYDAFGRHRRARYGRAYGTCSPYGGYEVVPPGLVARVGHTRCGYRYYVASRWANLVYGARRYYPRYVPVSDAASASDEVLAPPTPPAVPLGERGEAQAALFRGDAADAEKRFAALVEKDAKDADAWTGLLHSRFLAGDFVGAAGALRRAAGLGAVSPSQRLDVKAAHEDPERFRRRLGALEARVRFSPLDRDAKVLLAYLESGLGRSEDARLDASHVLAARPSDPAARALLSLPPEPPVEVSSR